MPDLEDSTTLTNRAILDFQEAHRKAVLEDMLARMRRQPADLLSYDEVRKQIRTIESARRHLENIPIDRIVGSVNRYTDFTRSFLPRNESDSNRWARVKIGVETMTGLPPIEVYRVGDVYFVLDGHHRVSVARDMGATTIEGYVTPVSTHVPLLPGDSPDDIILRSEYDSFLATTHLDELRPGANLLVTAPGQYQHLLEHIAVHRYFMGEKQHKEIKYDEAVTNWYDTVYCPIAELIRDRNLLRDFPGRTETDLYLWIMDHRVALSGGGLGWEVRPDLAAADLVNRYSPIPSNRLPRVARNVMDFLVPEPLSSGPAAGVWRTEHQSPRRGNHIFDDILTAVPGGKDGWPAVKLAIEVARREEARLIGMHVVGDSDKKDSLEVQNLEAEFQRLCDEAGIQSRMVIETGQAASLLCQRSPWVDLIVFRLNYPPPVRALKRLRSGVRMLIRRCSSPLLAVPGFNFALDSALLAYGPGPKADEALYVATYLAGRWGLPLTVVTVQPDVSGDRKNPEQRSSIPHLIDRARQYLETHQVKATYVEGRDDDARDPARCILLNAEKFNSGLLITGGYESNAFRESLFGSTVDRILRSTRRPVLICK